MGNALIDGKAGETLLLLGNEAIARGALEAGVRFVTCYPGTPSSEVPDAFFRMERAATLCDEAVVRTYHLPPTLQTGESSGTEPSLSFGEAVAKFEEELLVEALKKARGNMMPSGIQVSVTRLKPLL